MSRAAGGAAVEAALPMMPDDAGDDKTRASTHGSRRSSALVIRSWTMFAGTDRAWAWREEARVAAAELVGTALLVLLCGAGSAEPRAAAATAGGAVALLVQSLEHVSGAMFNPAVLLAALASGRVSRRRAAAVLGAQLAGAALGAAGLRALAGAPGAARPPAALPAPGARVPLHAAAAAEALGGACLALVNCGGWDARTQHYRDSWPLRIGVTVAALSLVFGEISGACFNPARSFGPALVWSAWSLHWLYWVAPLAGSLAATLLYCALWRPR